MVNLRDLRFRMRAIRQTLQVTKAMNLISTAKLRKGRRMLEDTDIYFTRIQKSMFDILSGAGEIESPFYRSLSPEKRKNAAVVVISSDKGLAGAYNANVFRLTNEICSRFSNPQLILIGSIGLRHYLHSSYTILENFSFHSQMPTLEDAGKIAEYIVSQYLKGIFEEVHVVHTHMFSTIKLIATELHAIPIEAKIIHEELVNAGNVERVKLDFEFLPSKNELFDALVPMYIRGLIYGSMVESYISEQCARMHAMDEASKNAEEVLDVLQIQYNRARQSAITQEMSEIVGGYSALAE
ncbi:MAG: ATP synthase F1 subunit gamma [Treponema sp.]|nr:ATP synthase F1 subunit gamma [Treponema sp.]